MWRYWWQRSLLIILLILLCVRSLPYAIPIHAEDIAQDQFAVEFLDRNGLFLGTLLTQAQEHTAVVPLDQISPTFLQAILSAEDQRFYQHGPLDLRAVGRSLLEAAEA
ncbi:MAG: transglycosylase domain-containing protein, partial [Cyanobacteria bacterium J06648_10]